MQSTNDYLFVKKDVIEEKKSAGGIIISSVFHHSQDIVHKNICYATVVYDNENIPFIGKGDRIIMNPQKGTNAALEYDDYTVIKKDQFLAKIVGGKFIVNPDSIMIKINKSDNEALYSKWIVRNDGSKVQLFLRPEPESHSITRSAVFVSMGEVVQCGSNIEGVKEGDISLLDYTVDNFVDNVLYFDEDGNKYIVIEGSTSFHEEDYIIYADRTTPKDTIVYKKGDLNVPSPLLGVIRGEELIARAPYVFVEHQDSEVSKVSNAGIMFTEKLEIMEREILSVSERSSTKYGIGKGQKVLVKDMDIFDVKTPTGTIQCIMDCDVLMKVV